MLIPERFQIVEHVTVLKAGLHILPMLVTCAVGSFLGGAISAKRNYTSFTLVAASCLQLLGVGLMTMPIGSNTSPNVQYGFQAIFGLGVGLSFSAATILTNIIASDQSQRATAQGAVAQARVLGGCFGLAICTVIFNAHVNGDLKDHLKAEDLASLYRSPLASLHLPNGVQELVKKVYVEAFADEIRMMMAVCAVMVAISLLTLQRHPAPLERLTGVSDEVAIPSRLGGDAVMETQDMTRVDSAMELHTMARVRNTV